MRPLYLHVGLHKTGTSFLQRLLHENRELLAGAGLGLAPLQDPASGSHHPLLAAIEAEGPEAVFDRVAGAPGARVLISAEELSQEMNDRPGYLAALHAAAARHFEPRLVIFLRRQDFLKESVYAQVVKDWFEGTIHEDTHYDYDHAARLARLEAVFGANRVHVALYRDQGPNDIVGDLLAATDTRIDRARLHPIPPQNVSMHRRKLLFLAGFPKPASAREDQPKAHYPVRFVTRLLSRSTAIADDGGRFLLSPAERQALVARHLDGNRRLVARHGIADAGSFVDLPDPDPSWTPPAPITGRELAAVWREAVAAARAGRDPLRAAWLAARLSRRFASMAARTHATPALRAAR